MAQIEERVRALEHQATALKAYLVAAVAVAGIFGLTGAWGFLSLSKVRSDLISAQSQADVLKRDVSKLAGDLEEISKTIDPATIETTIRAKIDSLAKPTFENLAAQEISRAVAVIDAKNEDAWAWGGAYDRRGEECVTPNPHTGKCECPTRFDRLDLVDAGVVFCYRRMSS